MFPKWLREWWQLTKEVWGWSNDPLPPEGRQPPSLQDIMEMDQASMEMHYGDEPLYYSDPPEWPDTAWTR